MLSSNLITQQIIQYVCIIYNILQFIEFVLMQFRNFKLIICNSNRDFSVFSVQYNIFGRPCNAFTVCCLDISSRYIIPEHVRIL